MAKFPSQLFFISENKLSEIIPQEIEPEQKLSWFCTEETLSAAILEARDIAGTVTLYVHVCKLKSFLSLGCLIDGEECFYFSRSPVTVDSRFIAIS